MRFAEYGTLLRAFFLSALLFFPGDVHAFRVSPSVVDVSFTSAESAVQIFSVINTDETPRTYTAKLQSVSFAADGTLADLSEVSEDVGGSIVPQTATIAPGDEVTFRVQFLFPEQSDPGEVFGVSFAEKRDEQDQLSGEFLALIFPENLPVSKTDEGTEPPFRLDVFAANLHGRYVEVAAQFTNTGTATVKPESLVVIEDMFGRELAHSSFLQHEGRLPVGTTRMFVRDLPEEVLGNWHVGGKVRLTLWSIDRQSATVQTASVELRTFPGRGMLVTLLTLVLIFLGGVVMFIRKRGILPS